MKDLLSKMVSLQLGVLSVTREKAKGIVGELIKTGEVNQEQAKGMVDKLVAKGEKEKQQITEMVQKLIKEQVEVLGVPTKDDIEELRKEIKVLKEAMNK